MSRVVWRKDDGTWTSDASFKHRVSPWDVAQSFVQFTDISPRLVVGSAKHETNYTINERDLGDQSDGSSSDGILQVSTKEAKSIGMGDRDLLTLDGNLEVYAALMERNRDQFRKLAPDKAGTLEELFYLALSHNQGVGAMIKTIQAHGVDAALYVRNNGTTVKPGFNGPAIVAYYQDAETGGPDYQAAWDALGGDTGGGGGAGGGGLVAGLILTLGGLAAWKWLSDHGYI